MAYTTIDDSEAYFQVKTYTGTNASTSFTLDGDTDMQPDLVWLKVRSAGSGQDHTVFDSVRGVQKFIETNTTNAEATGSNYLTAFNSDGFTLGNDQSHVNANGDTYVAWCWKESATAGFDMVSFTGNATDDRDINHSLSAVPHFWVTRNRTDVENWVVYHHKNTSAPETDYLVLDDTNATGDSSGVWSDEAPTSSVYTVGTANSVNGNTDAMITYLWTGKQGFSKFGSYIGNGNADGTFVYTGFKPAWVMVKNTGATENWIIFDNKRPGYNLTDALLKPNLNNVESTSGVKFDLLSNGFKARVSDAEGNSSGGDFIYMAFAEAPFVNSNGVPCNAR